MYRPMLVANKELALKNWDKQLCAYATVSSSKAITMIAKEVIDTKYPSKEERLEIEDMAQAIVAQSHKWMTK